MSPCTLYVCVYRVCPGPGISMGISQQCRARGDCFSPPQRRARVVLRLLNVYKVLSGGLRVQIPVALAGRAAFQWRVDKPQSEMPAEGQGQSSAVVASPFWTTGHPYFLSAHSHLGERHNGRQRRVAATRDRLEEETDKFRHSAKLICSV